VALEVAEVPNPRQVAERQRRIEELAAKAFDLLRKGVGEDEVRFHLAELAVRNWAPSYMTLKDYVDAAVHRAKIKLETDQRNLYTWVPHSKDPSDTEP